MKTRGAVRGIGEAINQIDDAINIAEVIFLWLCFLAVMAYAIHLALT